MNVRPAPRVALLAALALAILPARAFAEIPRPSPDGSLVATVRAIEGGQEIVVERSGGSGDDAEARLWVSPVALEAQWSPDSRRLAVFDHRADDMEALLFEIAASPSGAPSVALKASTHGIEGKRRWIAADWNPENRQATLRGLRLGENGEPSAIALSVAFDAAPLPSLSGDCGAPPGPYAWGEVKACGETKSCCAGEVCAAPAAESAAPAAHAAPAAADPAVGRWEGQWTFKMGAGSIPGGKLACEVERTGEAEWKATFEAEWGKKANQPAQQGIWKVELLGKREGEKIVFGGDVDLGAASGGVFHWSGAIEGDSFLGEYTSKLVNGSFDLKRTP